MPWWLTLALAAIPLGGAVAGIWWAIQLWLAKRQGKTEQSLSDKLANSEAENSILMEFNEFDKANRALSPEQRRDKLR